MVSPEKYGKNCVYTSSLVPYQDLQTEGSTLMIIDSGHINCVMSHPEVLELHESVLPCHLLSAYNRYIMSATRSTTYLRKA